MTDFENSGNLFVSQGQAARALYFLIDPFFKSGAEMLSCKSLLSCMETNKITKVSICTLRTQTVMKPKQSSPEMMLFKCQAGLEKDFNGGNRNQLVRAHSPFTTSPMPVHLCALYFLASQGIHSKQDPPVSSTSCLSLALEHSS